MGDRSTLPKAVVIALGLGGVAAQALGEPSVVFDEGETGDTGDTSDTGDTADTGETAVSVCLSPMKEDDCGCATESGAGGGAPLLGLAALAALGRRRREQNISSSNDSILNNLPVAISLALGLSAPGCGPCLSVKACLSIAHSGDTGETGDTGDTGDTSDSGDTSDTSDSGDTGAEAQASALEALTSALTRLPADVAARVAALLASDPKEP